MTFIYAAAGGKKKELLILRAHQETWFVVSCGVRNVKCRVWILECRACRVAHEVCSEECESLSATACVWLDGFAMGIVRCYVWSANCKVQSEERKASIGFSIF